MNATGLSLAELARGLRSRRFSAVEIVDRCRDAHRRSEPLLNAWKTWNGDAARLLAQSVDKLFDSGMDFGPLMGLPVSVKDLYGVPGMPVFAGTDQALPAAWEAAGPVAGAVLRQFGIVMGKTHTVEFAFGGLGVNAHWGTPFNPWSADGHRTPGGSSSGAGVSLAQGSALVALGTDTAGSVRVPASMTGQVGLKTTHGRWPLEGIVPLSPSLDTAGLLTRSVEDMAFAFAAVDALLGGRRPACAMPSLNGLRLGVADNFFWDGLDPGIGESVSAAIELLAGAGARIVPVRVPHCDDVYEIFRQGGLAASELAAFMNMEFPARIARLDPVVRARVAAAEQVSSVEYLRRRQVLQACAQRATAVFADVDALLAPTVAITPPLLDGLADGAAYARANMMALRNTVIGNLFGWCALTLPVGLDARRMPVGLQLMGAPMTEARLIGIGLAVEARIGRGPEILGHAPALA